MSALEILDAAEVPDPLWVATNFGVVEGTMSPFLPGTSIQFAFDSTSLGWFKECPRKYYYSMVQGWRARGESANLTFGIMYHSALEWYDRLRAAEHSHDYALHESVHKTLIESNDWRNSDHKTKNRESLIRSIVWYLEHFKDDPAHTITLANGKPAVELSFRMELDFGPSSEQPYILCGHLDRLVEYQDQIFVSDRKTTGSTPGSYYFDQYEPDNQMTLYTIAGQVVFNAPVKGVIIDAAQIAIGFTRFERGLTYRTSRQLDEWRDDFGYWAERQREAAERDRWPMNDKACHKFGGCPFRPICAKDPSVRDKFLESNYSKQPWNPLDIR